MGKKLSAKKRWRKNDISDIEAALEKERQVEDLLGTKPQNINKLPDNSLFKIDKAGSKKIRRKKEFYRGKLLTYEKKLQPSHILSPVVPKIKPTTPSDLTMAERIADKLIAKKEKRKERLNNELILNTKTAIVPFKADGTKPTVYDIWNTPQETRKPIFGSLMKPLRAVIRKPTELPSIELPTSDISYNPTAEDMSKLEERINEKELAHKKKLALIDRAIQVPQTLRTGWEIKKSLPKLTEKELLKLKKDAKKGRKKPSKPYQSIKDKNYSEKYSRTQRNKQKKRKFQLNIERKNRMEKQRNQDMENVEKYTTSVDQNIEMAKRRRKILVARRKLNSFKTKSLRQRFIGFAHSGLVKSMPVEGGSLRSLKPIGNAILETTARYEKRNMVVG